MHPLVRICMPMKVAFPSTHLFLQRAAAIIPCLSFQGKHRLGKDERHSTPHAAHSRKHHALHTRAGMEVKGTWHAWAGDGDNAHASNQNP